jgi:hypothetical protein
MILPGTMLLRLMDWLASRLGFDFGMRGGNVFDSLDEREVNEQLHYGRD